MGRSELVAVFMLVGVLTGWSGQLIPQKLSEIMNRADLAVKVKISEIKQVRETQESPLGKERGPAVTFKTDLTAEVLEVLGGKCDAKTIKVKHSEHFDPYLYRQTSSSGVETQMKKGEEYIFFLRNPFSGQKAYWLIRAEEKKNFPQTTKAIEEEGVFGDVDKFVKQLKAAAEGNGNEDEQSPAIENDQNYLQFFKTPKAEALEPLKTLYLRRDAHQFNFLNAIVAIDNDDAHKFLDKALEHESVSALSLLISSTGVPAKQRHRYYRRHVMKDLSKNLEISLTHLKSNDGKFHFLVSLLNTTDKPMKLISPESCPTRILTVFNAVPDETTGELVAGDWRNFYYISKADSDTNLMTAKPKERIQYPFDLELNRDKADKDIRLVAPDIGFRLGKPGKFLVYALFEAQPRDLGFVEDAQEIKREDSWWTGRAVAGPVLITIPAK